MNRRTFLKSMAITCGAAVVCPVKLLRPKDILNGHHCEACKAYWEQPEREILLEKFRAAFKAIKFKPPVPKNTKLIIREDELKKLYEIMPYGFPPWFEHERIYK